MENIFVLLDNSSSENGQESLHFTEPKYEIKIINPVEIKEGFRKIEEATQQGLYVAGYFSYELGEQLLGMNDTSEEYSAPLMWFYAFEKCTKVDDQSVTNFLIREGEDSGNVCIYNFSLSEDKNRYSEKIAQIKNILAKGDSYQINYTVDSHFNYYGSPAELYLKLRKYQKVEYGAFINFPGFKALSFSPELFLRKKGDILSSKPMKGTMARTGIWRQDEISQKRLVNDEKIKSENLMIVDLIRNDLGAVAQPGSVKVESLFNIETYQTVFQMTSLIKSEIDKNISLYKIMRSMFPCGSITGAPKKRTMEYIRKLENRKRGLYTGSVGYFDPSSNFCLNVAIRTIELVKNKKARMGVGGGILYESISSEEYQECLDKINFLKKINSEFQLIETFLFDGSRFPHLTLHLDRMEKSALFFDFNFHRVNIEKKINEIKKGEPRSVRLSLHCDGCFEITSTSYSPNNKDVILGISDERVSTANIFQSHKTTHRDLYDLEFEKFIKKGMDEVLFLNEKGQLVEASRHNIFIKNDEQWFTPLLDSGALPGIGRKIFMAQEHATEKHLYVEDLIKADEILLVNSLRGRRRAKLV